MTLTTQEPWTCKDSQTVIGALFGLALWVAVFWYFGFWNVVGILIAIIVIASMVFVPVWLLTGGR